MIYHGAFIGIDYRDTSSRLSGCIADSNAWRAVFEPFCAGKLTLQEKNATKRNVVDVLKALTKECPAGSEHFGIATFSGHGTFRKGAVNEADGRDEAICCYDFLTGGLLWDNEIATILAGSQMLLITDCCHSHTLIRATVVDSPEPQPIPRFVPFDQICEGLAGCEIAKICEPADVCRAAARTVRDASGAIPGVIHLAGCLDHEYSYDTPQGGAMTLAAIAAWRALPLGAVHAQWIAAIQKKLPTPQYPQHPQMTATMEDLRRVLPGKETPPPSEPSNPASTSLTFEGKVSDGRSIRGVIE